MSSASVSASISAEAHATSEAVVLAFATVHLEYNPQNPDGTLDPGLHFTDDQKAQKQGQPRRHFRRFVVGPTTTER